jgi:outer membrane protein assembly factor BamB
MKSSALLLLALALNAVVYAGSPWPQFRGPAGQSTATNENLPDQLDTAHNLLWQAALPGGASSPIIVGDRAFLTGFADGKLVTLGVNLKDGRIAWRHESTPEKLEVYMEKLGSPAASTCATDGERVVSYFGSYGLACFDLDGKALWEVKMPVAQSKDGFGSGTSPIIHDGLVYLLRDEVGPGNGFYAFDARTGGQVWKHSRDEFRVSYGTPVVWDGVLVALGDTRAKGYDLKTGEERWLIHGLSAYPCTTPTPGADGNLYIATWSPGGSPDEPMPTFEALLKMMDKDGDGRISRAEAAATPFKDFFDVMDKNKDGFWDRPEWEGNINWMKQGKNAVLAVKPGGHGDITTTHVMWRNDKGAPYVSSPLYYDGKLFMVKDGGFATLYDAATGKILYEKQRLGVSGDYYVSPVLVNDRIYVGATNGTLLVLDARATDKPVVLSKLELGEYLAASPAAAGNRMYIRTKEKLFAFGEK